MVQGVGYRFEAPSGWKVERRGQGASASDGAVALVGVSRFRLQKPYRPALFAAASKELDGIAERLADQLDGRVASSQTVRAAGARARSYRIEAGNSVQELTFVLRARREFQLLCRRKRDGQDDACRAFVSSFALT